MGQPSNLSVNIIDDTISVAEPTTGIVFLQGKTLRGPVNDPVDLITSERQFKLLFGGIDTGDDFAMLAIRMINRGVIARINRITDGAHGFAVSGFAIGSAHNLFKFVPKYPGIDYNNLKATITDASNGQTNYFDLTITHTLDPLVYETYPNLILPAVGPTAIASHYLDDIILKSQFVTPVYEDLSAYAVQLRPGNAVLAFTTGTNGGTIDLADYTGVKANKTGFYAFDDYDDSFILACPEKSEVDLVGLAASGLAYASSRKDLIYFQHIDNTKIASGTIKTERGSTNSPYLMITAGGVKFLHPTTGALKEASELADVIASIVEVHNSLGPWRSATGQSFGVLPNTLGVVNNFGTPALLSDLKILAGNQVNMVVNKNKQIYLNDDYTAQVANSAQQFGSTMFMIFYVIKTLRPTLEKFLGYPNTFTTWEKMYYTVKHFLDSMVTKDAWFGYEWVGDQFATSLNNLQINDAQLVLDGKYHVQLKVTAIAPLKDFVLDFVLDRTTGVEVQ